MMAARPPTSPLNPSGWYGLPMDADMVMDVRFLPDPHWVDELRPLTGQHPAVRDYVHRPGAAEFLGSAVAIPGCRRLPPRGERYMTIAIGCTSGKHHPASRSLKH